MSRHPQLVMFSDKSIHCDALCNVLRKSGGFELLQISDVQQLEPLVNQGKVILIVDTQASEIMTIYHLIQSHWLRPDKIVLFNVGDHYDFRYVLKWPQCCGVLTQDVSYHHWLEGLSTVASGEFWFTRKVMADLIASYRNQGNFEAQKRERKALSLTKREEDILKLIIQGESNAKIAESLFVSESTVKTHLYNAFKKIDVKNRRQARDWAREQLLFEY
ncbi:LuxR C-terminal-related transcriptional regulator [Photobacterium sp. CCB-ST2H9]|uniref:LuxR C-terminal-related transcriptional regulator n=1 Tax=unclassified Photobacterium TaxID=2628852 RepID=UPI0020043DFB|nr:LuxR C-terminal-related transcriptional regulator [Photobacterium sp. CCB-ST2H9]UTM59753.1 LuxR C-terminal-related transcriptional regulator [Photobacterium sp. CCB-ST2H9]